MNMRALLTMFHSFCTIALLISCSSEAQNVASSATLKPVKYQQADDNSENENAVKIYRFQVDNVFAHDETAFTQGLFFDDGYLFESTGQYGQSDIRKVDVQSGTILQATDIEDYYFGEGMTKVDDKIVSLTWKSGTGLIHSADDFKRLGSYTYQGEGWGLAYDGKKLIMSDGTNQLRFFDPVSFKPIGGKAITLKGRPLRKINELEWIDDHPLIGAGKVLANIWQTDWIAIINIDNGVVEGLIDMSGLLPDEDVIRMQRLTRRENVLNGIAWDKNNKKLFVTGKNWPKLFEITLTFKEYQ